MSDSSASLRRLGNSGLAVSVVGLGTNNFGMKLDLEQSRAVVNAALEHGINLFDTSDSYGASEQRLGEILQGRRDDVLIATKFGSDVRSRGQDNGVDGGARGSRRYIRRAVENSLRRLRTDWIDLAQPTVSSVIAGATSPEQVAANVKAGQWIPTTDDLAEIDRITQLHREG
ncbi:MAG TPA: aldo/keto reductase family protein [Kineosporiaceae bacterium]|nr:aldo/keto reductase family protein [Kineosporiaceae bacterium]